MIIVLWVIAILCLYMLFLAVLEPFFAKRKIPASSYMAHHDEATEDEDEDNPSMVQPHSITSTQMRTYGTSVMNRLDSRQTRWKMQVQEQRRNIYDRHSMLN